MEVLNRRHYELGKLLLKNSAPVSAGSLAMALQVSSKTVRSIIKELNEYLGNDAVTFIKGKGYQLRPELREESRQLLERQRREDLQKAVVPSDPEGRRARLIARILTNELKDDSMIDFYDLAEELFVSTSTLKNDIKLVQEKLSRYHLKIGITQKQGVFIKGKEENLSACISEYIFTKNRDSLAAV